MAKTPHNELIDRAISDLRRFLTDLSASGNTKDEKRASLISYWISDYVKMLRKEDMFNPKKLIRYKRGQIVKVHLGYRIGSEEGGLHYAIVIENDNPLSSNVITIVPLTSLKAKHDPDRLPRSNIYLGNAIYRILRGKLTTLSDSLRNEVVSGMAQVEDIAARLSLIRSLSEDEYNKNPEKWSSEIENIKSAQDENAQKLEAARKALERVNKLQEELQRMKSGSIALVNQITTISKQRIYDPLYKSDVFHEVRVPDDILDALDEELTKMFINCNQEK